MRYHCHDAPGSRLVALAPSSVSRGRSKSCKPPQSNLNTTSCREGSNALLISTLSATPPPMRSGMPVTLGCTREQWPTSGCNGLKLRPQWRKQRSFICRMLASGSKQCFARWQPLRPLIHASCKMQTENQFRSIYSMRPRQQQSQALKLRLYRVTARAASATNTSSGTR